MLKLFWAFQYRSSSLFSQFTVRVSDSRCSLPIAIIVISALFGDWISLLLMSKRNWITISNCHFGWTHAIDRVTAGIYCFIEPMKNSLDFFSQRSLHAAQLWYKFVKLILIEFPEHGGRLKLRTEAKHNELMRMLLILHPIGSWKNWLHALM